MSSEKALYIIHCQDDLSCGMVDKGERFGGSVNRMSVYADHKAYLASTEDPSTPSYIRKIAAGPMETDDLKYMVGSFFIVEATREEAETFNRNDPFSKNGVWKEVNIHKWVSPTTGIKAADPVTDNGDMKTLKMVVRG